MVWFFKQWSWKRPLLGGHIWSEIIGKKRDTYTHKKKVWESTIQMKEDQDQIPRRKNQNAPLKVLKEIQDF